MAKSAVFLVGADKGGVGKTTVARALLDYFSAQSVQARAFDTEAPRGTLKRFHPAATEIVDFSAAADQMRILDTLDDTDAKVTVVDVRAGLLSPTLRMLRDIGFLDGVKRRDFALAVFHILGPSIASLDEIVETADYVNDASYFLVKNYINNTTFFEWDPATYKSYFQKIRGATEITIPHLNELACEQVELASVPFLNFVASRNGKGESVANSFVLRGYVRHWIGQVWSEFDRVRLTDIVVPGEPLRQTGT